MKMKGDRFSKKTANLVHKLQDSVVKQIVVFDVLESTNKKAKEPAMSGEDEGMVVLTRCQTAGRGRFNRIWESPNGGLYLSFIL